MKSELKELKKWAKIEGYDSNETIFGRKVGDFYNIKSMAVYGRWFYAGYQAGKKSKEAASNTTPEHKEIMTFWWKMPSGRQWWKVESYNYDRGYLIGDMWQDKEWFSGRKSAEIPPVVSE